MKAKFQGAEYTVRHRIEYADGRLDLFLDPLPPTPKTIVQVAAEKMGYEEKKFRSVYDVDCAAYDAIEQRLQALERSDAKQEQRDAGGKEGK